MVKPEEAIKILKRDIELCRFNPLTGETMAMNEENEQSAKAMELAVKALRKVTPERPTHIATLLVSYTCPNCGNVIDEFTEFMGERLRVMSDYCKFCGQAIDWSECSSAY